MLVIGLISLAILFSSIPSAIKTCEAGSTFSGISRTSGMGQTYLELLLRKNNNSLLFIVSEIKDTLGIERNKNPPKQKTPQSLRQ